MIYVLMFSVLALSSLVGCFFVCWVVSRSLPVPDGTLKFIRFCFWWAVTVVFGSGIYWVVSGVLLFTFLGFGEFFEENLKTVSFLTSIPYFVGLSYGIRLQYFPKRSQKVVA